MTLAKCLSDKAKAGLVAAPKAKKAKERFRNIADRMIADGTAPNQAYAQAAAYVADETKKAAARTKHRLLARIAVTKALTAKVKAAGNLKKLPLRLVDDLDFDARSIQRMAHGRMGEFLIQHSPDILGNVRDPMRYGEFLKATHGQATTDMKAAGFVKAWDDLHEWFRKNLNAAGHTIAKLDNRGIAHSHDQIAIGLAKYPAWAAEIAPRLNWLAMIDPRTGQAFTSTPSLQYQDEFLKAAFENIVYGRKSKSPSWNNLGGSGGLEAHRIFAFKTAEDWIAYNKRFGRGDAFNAMMSEIEHLSRQLAAARKFGPDPEAGTAFLEQLLANEARTRGIDVKEALKVRGAAKHASRMMRYFAGSPEPGGLLAQASARFFSTTRKVLNAALLDRASVISIPSDLGSMNLAATAIGLNKENVLSTYVNLMADSLKGGGATRDDLLRQMYIADSFANPSAISERFFDDFPAAAWSNVMSNAAMQVQGLTAHTDNLRLSIQHSFSAEFASQAGKAWKDLPDQLRLDFEERGGITEADWDDFRNGGGMYQAPNGATFLNPMYWHAGNALADKARADEVFLKFQAWTEKWTELMVPTQSLIAKGIMHPKAWGMTPGSLPYEFLQSAGMFKTFAAAFIVNQSRMFAAMPTGAAKAWYATKLLATSTLVGAFAIQMHNLLLGRDPETMDENFMFRALLRGGGLGPAGDLLQAGTTTWGGGLASYLAGPVPTAANDALKLTFGNVIEAYQEYRDGKQIDTNFIPEAIKLAKKYTPMGQTPIAAGGAAIDRMLWDQLQAILDPESVTESIKAQRKVDNLYRRDTFWLPGQMVPSRAPNLGNAIGQ